MLQLSPLSVTHTSTVTPDQIDELGHMNVRFYGQNAIAASKVVCTELGHAEPTLQSTYTRHHNEQLEGSELQVQSAVLPGADQLQIFHELRNRATNDLAATFVHRVDVPSSAASTFELPEYGRPRSLSLDSNALVTAPTIDQLRSLDLAIRVERSVDAEDTGGADRVPSWLANNMIWGGERPDGDPDDDWIIDAPGGERVAFATMESRLWIGELPTQGTPIQSFGCVLALSDKISHGLNWCYDVASGEPLVIFEVINLAFDINGRRSMIIPDDMRTRELTRLHPEFAV